MQTSSSWVQQVAGALRRVLAPDYCAACDEPISAGQVFCAACGPCPERSVALDDGTRAAGDYAPPLSTAILRMKFGQRADLADRLAVLLPRPEASLGEALVVPVPLHYTRLVQRGFNPAALLAREACRRGAGRYAPRVLERVRDTPHQSSLPAELRRTNVAGAFEAREPVRGHVILVDDVVTTGSTTAECRRALYAAGVVHVTVMALAVTRPR